MITIKQLENRYSMLRNNSNKIQDIFNRRLKKLNLSKTKTNLLKNCIARERMYSHAVGEDLAFIHREKDVERVRKKWLSYALTTKKDAHLINAILNDLRQTKGKIINTKVHDCFHQEEKNQKI